MEKELHKGSRGFLRFFSWVFKEPSDFCELWLHLPFRESILVASRRMDWGKQGCRERGYFANPGLENEDVHQQE